MRPVAVLILCFMNSMLAMAYVDEPQGCWQSGQRPCAVRANKSGESFRLKESGHQGEWVASKKSSWIIESGVVKLLSGQMWVKSSSQFVLRTQYIEADVSGEMWFDHQEDQTLILNLNAEVVHLNLMALTALAKNTEVQILPVGFQNWYGSLDTQGMVTRGVLRPIERVSFFKQWAQQMKVSESVASVKLGEWKSLWQTGAHVSSEFYREIVVRKIAQEDQQKAEKTKQQQLLKDEKLRLRQMFRARNGLGD